MSVVAAPAPFSLVQIQRLLGLPRSAILQLVTAGFVTPQRGARNEYRFSFRDMVLLRTAYELRQADIPTRRILQALRKLREALPAGVEMTGLRLSAVGPDVVVQQGEQRVVADSGQLLLDLEVSEPQGTVTVLARPAPPAPERSAQAWLAEGESVEDADPHAAESAYRAALRVAPDFVDAYLNLGALLCDSGRWHEAAVLYEQALRHCGDQPLLHYNRAVALEDLGDMQGAARGYETALGLDPQLADAHFNLARIHQELGHLQLALRHFNAYRRLQSAGEGGGT